MKYAFVIPDSPFLIDQKVFPFLGVLYLSAVLKKRGEEVKVYDLADQSEIPDIEADVIGITATTPQFMRAVEIRNILKGRRPYQKIVIGGPHVSAAPKDAELCFDAVCVGEGEEFVLNPNLGGVVDFGYSQNLDEIPFPDWDAIDLSQYQYFINGKRTMSMLTSRGCPYACSFCCKSPWGQKIRYRSADNVLQEIGLLKERGYEGVMLYDDEFFLNRSRDRDIAYGMGAAGMVWRCFARSDIILKNTNLIKEAADNGLKEILIGCETGSNVMLENINKKTNVWMNAEAIVFLKSLGVRVKAALIVGLPGESPASIKATEEFVEKVKPDSVDFTVLRVMPGSDIWNHPENYDVKFDRNFEPYKTKPGFYKAGVSTSAMTAEEVVVARDYLDRKFNPQLWK